MRVELVSVGDELLRGETVNTNAAWLGRELEARGVDVTRVTTIPDDVSTIASVIESARERVDAVVTTGGLGPTHDDLTMEGVAAAFDRTLDAHPDAIAWIEAETDRSVESLAPGTIELPAGSRMLPNDVGVAPGCAIDAVYVLPGVPEEMKRMFRRIETEFEGEPRHTIELAVGQPEREIADDLDQLRNRFDVRVGSYPGRTVRVRVSGIDRDEVEAAERWLRDRVEVR